MATGVQKLDQMTAGVNLQRPRPSSKSMHHLCFDKDHHADIICIRMNLPAMHRPIFRGKGLFREAPGRQA
ncbi:hypothetical protein QV13_25600 [Mesorhizobium hungaricum]|uniref:Uncharacterized protein n=1 Tax=Mesorhizobium hungaricum TaxID=1566387 RepID=A0A1C2DDU3_9HYPH|nr:hypothetical protein QV13_25600 [Mesorhizobium hungaricum]